MTEIEDMTVIIDLGRGTGQGTEITGEGGGQEVQSAGTLAGAQ